MKKISWPWIGSTDHEMGSISPKGESTDIELETSTGPDSLVTEKSVTDETDVSPGYEGGIISPVDGVDWNVQARRRTDEIFKSLANKKKVKVEVLNDNNILTSFSCGIAETFQDRVAGLQAYKSLQEGAGLLFPYKRPEDVIYHMGTVSYPIDIIFIDSSNTIKKLYKNIQPGTLGTFGCADVQNVLEICGGLSDRLGIKKGNRINISSFRESGEASDVFNRVAKKFTNKDVILKYSKFEKSRITNWNDYPILIVNDSADLKKQASESNTFITSLASQFKAHVPTELNAFDFDGLIEKNPIIRVYKIANTHSEDDLHITLNESVCNLKKDIGGEYIYRECNLLTQELRLSSDEVIVPSLSKSFSEFIPKDSETRQIFSKLKLSLMNKNAQTVIFTRLNSNFNILNKLILSRARLEFGDRILPDQHTQVQVREDFDASDVINLLSKKYANKNIKLYSDSSILKRAGIPVSDDVKAKAKTAYRYLDEASKILERSVDNMDTNVDAYSEIKDKPDIIAKTKGQYEQSVNAQVRVVKSYLLKLKEAIKILNDIKDISTTFEIIDGLASSAKITSDGAEEIFELSEKLDNPDFHMVLSEKTDSYKKSAEDLDSIIERAKQYINSEILGLVILSS